MPMRVHRGPLSRFLPFGTAFAAALAAPGRAVQREQLHHARRAELWNGSAWTIVKPPKGP
jgi:hypothetical protein